MSKEAAVTKSYLDKKLDQTMQAHTDEIVGVVHEVMKRVDERMTVTEMKHAKRFDELEAKVETLQRDMNAVLTRLDSIEKDIAINEDERIVMGMQLTRLHDWVEKAAKKVGVEFTH